MLCCQPCSPGCCPPLTYSAAVQCQPACVEARTGSGATGTGCLTGSQVPGARHPSHVAHVRGVQDCTGCLHLTSANCPGESCWIWEGVRFSMAVVVWL